MPLKQDPQELDLAEEVVQRQDGVDDFVRRSVLELALQHNTGEELSRVASGSGCGTVVEHMPQNRKDHSSNPTGSSGLLISLFAG